MTCATLLRTRGAYFNSSVGSSFTRRARSTCTLYASDTHLGNPPNPLGFSFFSSPLSLPEAAKTERRPGAAGEARVRVVEHFFSAAMGN